MVLHRQMKEHVLPKAPDGILGGASGFAGNTLPPSTMLQLWTTQIYLSTLASRRYVSNCISKSRSCSSSTSTVDISCTNPVDPSDATPSW